MIRRMRFSGLEVTSAEWLAIGDLLFPGEREQKNWHGWRFYCDTCDRDFASLITPTSCQHCQAAPGPQAMTVTHKGFTGKTFPFFVPDNG